MMSAVLALSAAPATLGAAGPASAAAATGTATTGTATTGAAGASAAVQTSETALRSSTEVRAPVPAKIPANAQAARRAVPRWADYFAQRPVWRSTTCSADVMRMSELITETGTTAVVECTRLRTPLVWTDLSKGYGYLQVSRVRRVKARSDTRPTRVLFVNPGGPGVTADWLAPTVAALEPAVHATHDIVAVDARGTGGSLPVSCSTVPDGVTDYRAPTTAEIRAMQAAVKRTVSRCVAQARRTLPHLNTFNTIRDHDMVRALLGHQKIDFYGVSAGTWMAARYADYYPRRVGRFVLDSNVQFTADWRTSFAHQPRGFQRRFDQQFLPWAARRHADYGLGSTSTAVRATYNTLRSAAAARRLGGVTPQDLDNLVIEGLYTDVGFGDLAGELSDLRRELRRARPAAAPPAAGSSAPTGSAPGAVAAGTEDTVFMAIQCNDSVWSKLPSSYVAEGLRLGRSYPLLGYSWVTSPCAYWPFARTAVPRVRVPQRTPMLMVQAELDPATPYEGAVAAHRARPETRLLSVQDQGNHGVWLGDNPCVERTVGAYLTTGRMPAKDLVCPAVPLPSDARVYPVESPLPSAAAARPKASAATPKATASALSASGGASTGSAAQTQSRSLRDARLDRVREAARQRLVQGWTIGQ